MALVEYFERKASGKHIDGSRLFVCKTTRDLLKWTGHRGAYLRTAMGALVMFGVPPESYWPYDISKFDVEPTPFVYALGQNFQSVKYFRLDPGGINTNQVLKNVKDYLAGGFPSMFGLPVYEEFMNVPDSGLIDLPKPNSHLYGGNAIVAVGYDDNKQIGSDKGALLIRNSWGKNHRRVGGKSDDRVRLEARCCARERRRSLGNLVPPIAFRPWCGRDSLLEASSSWRLASTADRQPPSPLGDHVCRCKSCLSNTGSSRVGQNCVVSQPPFRTS